MYICKYVRVHIIYPASPTGATSTPPPAPSAFRPTEAAREFEVVEEATDSEVPQTPGEDPKNRSPNSKLRNFYGIDDRAARWIYFLDPPRGLGHG